MAFFRGDFFSQSLFMNTSLSIVIPEDTINSDLNVVYLFHGLTDNASGWFRLTSIERYARDYQAAVVMPEVQRGFYTDMEYGLKYFTYVAQELPKFVHTMFQLSLKREKSYVMGLSMGGYGALKCALSLPEQFRGAAAFSSCCDMRYNIENRFINTLSEEELKAIYGMDLQIGPENDLFLLAKKCIQQEQKPTIMLTCGESDILFDQNVRFYEHLKGLGFSLQFDSWEGDHNWQFWDQSIQKAFSWFFGSNRQIKNF